MESNLHGIIEAGWELSEVELSWNEEVSGRLVLGVLSCPGPLLLCQFPGHHGTSTLLLHSLLSRNLRMSCHGKKALKL